MNEENESSLEQRISDLERKVDLLVSRLSAGQTIATPLNAPPSQTASSAVTPRSLSASTSFDASRINVSVSESSMSALSPGQLLGFAGIACLFLAIILLVRLSIDSGWLTPIRQLLLASVFGVVLIAIPFIKAFEFKSYMSQLPALGVVVLHLAVYGGVFVHHLIDPDTALLLVSAVGVLSLALLSKFNFDAYALLSIFGTYLGALFLKEGFSSTVTFFGFILLWNVTYCVNAIVRKERKIILITSYIAIGLVALKVWSMPALEIEYIKVAVAQLVQFLVFLTAVASYSTIHRSPLKHADAVSFFPLVLFFYGLEYHLFDKINPQYATGFALVFAASIFAVYRFVRNHTAELLESADVMYTIVAAVLAHSIFFVVLSDELKIYTPFALCLAALTFRRFDFAEPRFKGAIAVCGVVAISGLGLLFTGSSSISKDFLLVAGAIYGIFSLGGFLGFSGKIRKSSMSNLAPAVLLFAHSQILLVIYRCGQSYLDRSFVAPLWIVYAFVILAVGQKMRDKEMAKTSFPIIILGLIRFMLIDFSRFDSGARIIALLLMGGLIFVGGYMYKRTLESSSTK